MTGLTNSKFLNKIDTAGIANIPVANAPVVEEYSYRIEKLPIQNTFSYVCGY